MDTTINFTVNGESRSVTTDPRRPLLEVLREDLQLTGTKFGCGEGDCRACTVLLNGESTPSCMTPVGSVDKQTILTVEGLATHGKLHPVQQAFLDAGPFQCGYCTSGMMLETVALLGKNPHPTDAEIVSRLQPHICRCCSYVKYLEAVRHAAMQLRKARS